MASSSSRRTSALDRRLPEAGAASARAPIATFAVLYAELLAYHRSRTASTAELEARLSEAGAGIGARMAELTALRRCGWAGGRARRRGGRLRGHRAGLS